MLRMVLLGINNLGGKKQKEVIDTDTGKTDLIPN